MAAPAIHVFLTVMAALVVAIHVLGRASFLRRGNSLLAPHKSLFRLGKFPVPVPEFPVRSPREFARSRLISHANSRREAPPNGEVCKIPC